MDESYPQMVSGPFVAIRNVKEWDCVKIQKINRGFLVEVGCKKLAFEKEKDLFDALKLYFKDPDEAEKKYIKEK